ncbi:putative acyl-CoA dehydrogenase [Gordonia hirsuta DSM 44140 = NBRC 16056]|uniref:Putative acyl-CoA dehydrogenase n=1 Tax=Gordonia hirsuta DSM 44140 = NBRC 16056 TaxID=1121927 RepID=L7LD88_9ACTN|nr:acyl-CoA dehydrogenase family protein [Gordonia hirsuta]GAC57988.1 putative acyl-CoA dehydrogenase [Gordonia hirsuta DSM 44140 = NBRC 16056]
MGSVTSEELRALGDAVRDVCRRRGGTAGTRTAMAGAGRRHTPLWEDLAGGIGVAGLLVPEAYDGLGASVQESAAVLEALGEVLAPVPVLSSAVLATGALLAAGDEAAATELLPRLASGELSASLCWAGPHGWDHPGVVAEAGLLSGTADYVLDGETAEVFLVLAGTPDGAGPITLHHIAADAPGVTVTAQPVLDPTRPLARVHFASAPAQAVPAPDGLVEHLRTLAWALLSAEQTGGAARALEMTVEHTLARTQFGRSLASFQALKHAMADMYVLVETMRSCSAAAVAAVAAGDRQAPALAAAAHVYCSENYRTVTGQAIQLHGGIGITAEHDIGLYFKRAQADAQLFGPPHRAAALIEL